MKRATHAAVYSATARLGSVAVGRSLPTSAFTDLSGSRFALFFSGFFPVCVCRGVHARTRAERIVVYAKS